MTNHLTFLCRCQDLRLVPPGLTIKIPVHSRREQEVTKRLEQELIRDRIHNNRWKKHQLWLEILSKLTPFLEKISIIDDKTRIQQYLDKSYEQEFHMVKARQITKLEKIKTTNMKIQSHYSPVEAIVNISKRQLKISAKQRSQLHHYHQANSLLRSNSEDAALKIPKARADELRWKVKQALEKSKPPKPNFSKMEKQALKMLQYDNSIIILPADKGNATMVMDRVEYSNKLADLIGSGGYCKVKKDPTPKTERKLSQIIGKNKDLIPQTKYRRLIQHYSKLPHIYGLPKIHKDSIPLRPIVSNRGSTCHSLSHFLVEIISPLTGKSSSYVKNSAHFVERIIDAPIHSKQMVSLDEVSLFTKVPTDDTLAVVQDKLAAEPLLEERTCIQIDNVMEMLTFCMETTYFGMGSDIYR